jgi:hypothetical protein
MKRTQLLLSLFVALLVAMPLRAQEDKPKSDAPKQSEAGHSSPTPHQIVWYRVDLTVSEFEDGKKVNTRHYTLHLNDTGDRSSTKFGTRVPIPNGSNGQINYIDIGLNINMRLLDWHGNNEHNMLDTAFELSSFAIPEQAKQTAPGVPILRQVQTTNSTPLPISKPIVVASLDDPNSTKRYQFEVMLTKL